MILIEVMHKQSLVFILLLFLTNISLLSQEEIFDIERDNSIYHWEKFSVNIGGFLTTLNNDISVKGTGLGLGVLVNLEDALGFDISQFVVRGSMEYHFGSRKRSAVRVGYFGFFRNSSKVLETNISIGDTEYPIGTEITTSSNKQIISAIYDYNFYMDDRIRLGASLGMYILPSTFSISAQNSFEESANIVAPLPVIGLSTAFFITPKLLIKQNVDILYFKTSDFKGGISDINLWLEYNPFKHFGFGLGYNAFSFNFTTYNDSGVFGGFEGTMKTGFSGLMLFGKCYF